MKGVLLHGGKGTRLKPITHTEVKQLLPVAGKAISQYCLEDMISIGIKDIDIVVGTAGATDVIQYYGDGSRWGIKISYTHQDEPKGIAHAVGLVQEFVGNDPFVVYLGDNLVHGGIGNLSEDFKLGKYDAYVLLSRVNNPERYGVAEMRDGKLYRLVEKPKHPASNLALTGIYFFNPTIFEVIKELKPSFRGELEITEAIQKLIEKGQNVGCQEIGGWWKDTGTAEDMIDANRLILDGIQRHVDNQTEYEKNIIGRVYIGKGVQIDSRTKIKGPSYIGDGTQITNSYIGPNTSIGSNCDLNGMEIDDSIVMDNCIIVGDGEVRIYESLIGTGCVIRKGNGVKKGSKLIVGRDSQIAL